MLTRRVDAALTALSDCHERLPFLRDLSPPGSPRRAALDGVLVAIALARAVMATPDDEPAQRG
jgi:hypothetical protein